MWSSPSAILRSAPPSSATCVSASEGRDVPRGRRVLLRDRARPRPPRDPDRRSPWLGGKAPYLALGQPSRPALVREAHHGIPPLLGDVDPLVRPRASALWRLLGARGRSPRDVLPPHRHLGLSLVRVQSPLRRPPVPQGTDLVVPHLTLGVPRPYLLVIVFSLCAGLAPALWTGAWLSRAEQWVTVFGEVLALTVVVTAVTLRPRRRQADHGVQGVAKVRPK